MSWEQDYENWRDNFHVGGEFARMMSYDDYLIKTDKQDDRESWIEWKTDCCRMSYREAIMASYDPEWGYEA